MGSRRNQRKKRSRRKVQQLFIGTVALVAILAIVYLAYTLSTQGKAAQQKTPASTTATTTASSTVSTLEITAATMSSTSETTTTAESESTSPLLAGKNHNEAAAAYAYSTQEVQNIMAGVTPPMTGDRICFLTFDDGANTTITPQILDVLKANDVPATFFIVGNTLGEEVQPILKRQIAEGHAIAMHSYNHNYDLLYPGRKANAAQIAKEADQTQAALQNILGKDFYTGVWRYPGGHMSWENLAAADAALNEKGIHYADWNAMSGDAQPLGDRPTDAAAMAAYQANSITEYLDVHLRVVLMHDAADKNVTVAALPAIIQFYKDHGFKFGVLE